MNWATIFGSSVELQMPRLKLEVLRKPCSTDMDIAAHAIA